MSFDHGLKRGCGNDQGAGRDKHHVGWIRIESVALDEGGNATHGTSSMIAKVVSVRSAIGAR
jgi:hypothetical protein